MDPQSICPPTALSSELTADRPGIHRRGFASLSPERRRAIASQGGKTAHARGVAHEFSSQEARTAGQKGGIAVSKDTEHMATIGRRGGLARGHSYNPHTRRSTLFWPLSGPLDAGDDAGGLE